MTINRINKQHSDSTIGTHYKEFDEILESEDETRIRRTSFLRTIIKYCRIVACEIKNNIATYILSIFYIFISVMNKLFAKRTTNALGNYSFFISLMQTFNCSVTTSLIYFFNKYYFQYPEEKKKTNIFYYFLISLFDSLSIIISFIGLTKTAGNIQSFILQLNIPISMFFCFIVLKYRYNLYNYIGAFIIVATIALIEIKMSYETQEENSIIYNFFFMLSLLPGCFSNMTKEFVLKKYNTNIFKLCAVVSTFQIFTSFLIFPIYTLPILKPIQFNYSEIFTHIKNGFFCLFFGRNTILENCGLDKFKLCDNCHESWKVFYTYAFFNICDNLMASMIINKFSTMVYTIISCTQGPALSIAYYFKIIAKDALRKSRASDFVTLIGYLIGSIFYRIGNFMLHKETIEGERESIENINEKLTNTSEF